MTLYVESLRDRGFNIADGVSIDESVEFGSTCRSVNIGFGTRLNRDIFIDVECLDIGEYVTVHHGTVIHGTRVQIGHNCWVGHYCILDGHGGLLKIGNNVGIGAMSQLWSHMKFGDRLAGCQWYRMEECVIEDDVWLVGHCIVAAIHAESRSMLMTGGVAVKTMLANRTYAGSPAKDMTEVFGPQFEPVTPDEMQRRFVAMLDEWVQRGGDASNFRVLAEFPTIQHPGVTYFIPSQRAYVPCRSSEEQSLIRHLLYEKAKLIPAAV